jgi:Fe-S-cluster containining protein
MGEPFYQDGLQFSCTTCHACCRHDPGYVFLSKKDLDRMLAYLNLEAELFVKKYCRWVDQGGDPILSLVEKSNFDCIFWDQGCTIYQARPDQCRSYPFWPGPLSSQEDWDWEKRFCPGIGTGERHPATEIQDFLRQRDSNPPITRRLFIKEYLSTL